MAPLQDVLADLVDTLVFVDIDGVLNVGSRESNGQTLLFSEKNAALACRLWKEKGEQSSESIQRLISIWQRSVPQEEGMTFASYVSPVGDQTVPVFRERLARLIELAGEHRTVVLSSSWRKPEHIAHLQRLEEQMSQHLGEPFAFGAATAQGEEISGADRLRRIGDYIASHCQVRFPHAATVENAQLRVLVLEDFFISVPQGDGWMCDGFCVNSVSDAEKYLLSRAPAGVDISVSVVHTYDEWVTPNGLQIPVGCGLTLQHFQKAAEYLLRSAGLDSAARNALADVVKGGARGNTMADEAVIEKLDLGIDNMSCRTLFVVEHRHDDYSSGKFWQALSSIPWARAMFSLTGLDTQLCVDSCGQVIKEVGHVCALGHNLNRGALA